MGIEYIRAVINGKKIHAMIDDEQVTGHDAWTTTLCSISREELDKLIAWLNEIRSKIHE